MSWLRAHYEAAGASPYLGIHQRLDRETSGVLLFARRREANAALAPQFEGHRVEKTYVAVVEGRVPERTVLRHFMGTGDDARRVARAPRGKLGRQEQEALTDLSVVRRAGKRALVELVPRTGRTHQLRVQLATIGAPIVGDPEYGGAHERRMMLHARSLSLKHPTTGAPLRASAPIPADLERALAGRPIERPTSRADLSEAIVEAAGRRYGVVAGGDTNVARIVNGVADGIPGVTIDLYASHAVLSIYEDLDRAEVDTIAAAAVDAGIEGVYVKFRPKHASRIVDSRRGDVAPPEPIAGAAAPAAFEIVENGVPLEVRLGDGLSTGLFLDQRENRRRVAALAKDARVLNLFAYTASFSVVSALAGARATTSVDVSRTVLDWARRNLDRAGANAEQHACVESDVFAFLARAKARREAWDIVVLDPPSFSTTKKSTFSAEDDYEALAAAALAVVAPSGKLLACTNHKGISMNQLRKRLHAAARRAARDVKQMKDLPPPSDFPPPPGEEPHLKSVLVTLA